MERLDSSRISSKKFSCSGPHICCEPDCLHAGCPYLAEPNQLSESKLTFLFDFVESAQLFSLLRLLTVDCYSGSEIIHLDGLGL
ncbi:hypothetical protein Y1Q_0003444 [Alligator mississippiensis]|uniref:Uncharacterized protein n=1 Tax=Alligator mississippiensis TaxID=8496 RepID=A0A151N514_ALLMI|nr:hypothetical protein Y1Q_0003444 [Alligator mississippiensis]